MPPSQLRRCSIAAGGTQAKLFPQNGSQLGSAVLTTVPAGQRKQENNIFARAGVNYCLVGSATVEVTTAGGSVWAYASVVDNNSGDPTTVPVFVQ